MVKVALLGDMAFFGCHDPEVNSDVKARLLSLKNYLNKFDVVVGNLEAPICGPLKPVGAKSAHIRSGRGGAELLRWLGVTHVGLANNHSHDFGVAGISATIDALEGAGVEWFGLEGRNALNVDFGSARVRLAGLCAYSSSPNIVDGPRELKLPIYDLEDAAEILREARADARLPILAVHSGLEHISMPSAEDVQAARSLARVSDYIYFGHHPHVVQGIEVSGRSLLAYSLGNCIFDSVYTPKDPKVPLVALKEMNRRGLVLCLDVEGDKLVNWSAKLLRIGEHDVKIIGDATLELAAPNAELSDAETPDYRGRRKLSWDRHLAKRRSQRDLRFYLTRLNLSSVKCLLSGRRNARLQRAHVDAKLAMFGNVDMSAS